MTVAVPESLAGADDTLRCRWVRTRGERYADPFFQSTLARMRMAGPGVETTPIDALYERARLAPPVTPAAVIFHVSRCGSTLFGQLLAEAEGAAVISEAPVLDHILRSGRADRFQLFDAALRLMWAGAADARQLFVKTDCWHVFDASELRQLYPGVPFIFMYRSPAAVLASQQRGRGSHMVPGVLPGAAIAAPFDPATMSIDEYGARVLARLYGALLEAAAHDPYALLVSYEEGFPAGFTRAARWLGLAIDDAYRERIATRCRYHGKRPEEAFSGEAAPAPGSVDLLDAMALFRELEARRLSAIGLPA